MRNGRTVIVDGYNVIHRDSAFRLVLEKNLESGRDALIRYCRGWKAGRGDIGRMCVVFDGDSSVGGARGFADGAVDSIFTKTKEDADDRILELVRESGAPGDITVVSDDQYVAGSARQLGARTMSATEFCGTGNAEGTKLGMRQRTGSKTGLSAPDERKITESLMKEWGVK